MSVGTGTMRAVVLKGNFEVVVEDRPIPVLQHGQDVIIRTTRSALCGSDLHPYRGTEQCAPNFILGHEFVGEIVEKGPDVKTFNIGDKVVAPFCTCCGSCFYCVRGKTSRCLQGQVFGTSGFPDALDGAQAEYVRCPLADSNLFMCPPIIPEECAVLMADIFPTGYFAASRFLENLDELDRRELTVVCVGAGPVGICAIVCALTMVDRVYVIDPVPSRLEQAAKIGAIPIAATDDPVAKVAELSNGRGADVVIEVVGNSSAFQLAFDLSGPWGKISSIGAHSSQLPLSGPACYGKNITIAFGRCPVRGVFEKALKILVQKHESISFLYGQIVPLEDAAAAYAAFEARKTHKTIFACN